MSESETDDTVDSFETADIILQHCLPASNINTLDMCAFAIAQLQVSGVGKSALNNLVSSMKDVIMEIQNQTKDAVLNVYLLLKHLKTLLLH